MGKQSSTVDVHLDAQEHCAVFTASSSDDDVNTIAMCSTYRKPMGTWDKLQNESIKQAGSGVFSIEDGQFIKR
jgi:hypothetical protein